MLEHCSSSLLGTNHESDVWLFVNSHK